MSLIFFLITLGIPWFHLGFSKGLVKKKGGEFGFNWLTIESMYMGATTPIIISLVLLILELLRIEVFVGNIGYLFGMIMSFLMYEMYIQKCS